MIGKLTRTSVMQLAPLGLLARRWNKMWYMYFFNYAFIQGNQRDKKADILNIPQNIPHEIWFMVSQLPNLENMRSITKGLPLIALVMVGIAHIFTWLSDYYLSHLPDRKLQEGRHIVKFTTVFLSSSRGPGTTKCLRNTCWMNNWGN